MRWPFHLGKSAETEEAAPAPEPPRRRDWASLPAIEPVVAAPRLTAPTPEFIESLAVSHEPELSLQTLGHQVSHEAPHGLVTGIARPIEAYASSTELVGRPRRAARPDGAQRLAAGEDGQEEAAPAPKAEPSGELEPVLPMRFLPSVDTRMESGPPLTRVAEAAGAALAALTPIQRSAEQLSSPEIDKTAPTAPPVTTAPAAIQRLTLGQSRRLGLGAPLKQDAVQRQAAPEQPRDLPLVPAREAPTARGILGRAVAHGADEDTGRAAPAETLIPAEAPVPELGAPAIGQSVSSEATSEASSTELGVADLKLSTSRPLPPLFVTPAVQTSAAAPVPVQRESTPMVPTQDELWSSGGRARLAAPLSPVIGMRESQRTSVSQLELPASVARLAQRTVGTPIELPLARGSGVPHVWPGVGSGREELGEVQRLSETEPGPAASEAPSALTGYASPTAPAPAPTPSGEVAPPAAPTGAAAPDGEKEIHDLARRLFDPLMVLLRREILTERERAGMATDLR